MSQYMPYGGFNWVEPTLNGLNDLNDTSPIGRIYEVDVAYLEELHDLHNDLPFLSQNGIPVGSKVTKLMATFETKKNYIVHYRSLQQAIKNGLIVHKVHRVIQFNQSAWLAENIKLNTEMRKRALNDFEKDLFKLMNNAIFDSNSRKVSTRLDSNSSNQAFFNTKFDELKITVFYPLLDKLLSGIDLRFKQDTFDLVDAIACMLNMNLTQKTTKILSTFSKVSEDELITELKLLKNYENAMQLNGASSKSIYEWIDWLKTTGNSTVYTCVFKTLKMFTIIPVTSCTCERVFSKLTIVKNKLRSTMSQERLESLLLLFTEQEIVSKVDLNAVIDEFNSIEKPIFDSLLNEINKFKKNQLILELNKRNLNSEGTVAELKNRLLKYLNGESCLNDFATIDKNCQNLKTKVNTMDSKKPYFKPSIFSDSSSESIDAFLKKYERAASINGWSEQEKLQYIPAFLEGPALVFYENIENQNFNKWADLEKQLRN
ncbi:hypothetical protein QTP88_025085 [Uroleucon formosanum]